MNADASEGANVVGVTGISASGEYVYFTAYGQLVAAEGSTESENVANHTVGLYAYHDGHVSFVATIEAIEAGTARTGAPRRQNANTMFLNRLGPPKARSTLPRAQARTVSACFLQPATNSPSSACQNRNTTTPTPRRGKRTAELFEYHYTEGAPSNVCVSCQPEGQRPSVPKQVEEHLFGSTEGGWVKVIAGVPPLNLLDDGRVFFDSYAPLVSGATATSHPYEFAPSGYVSAQGETCEREAGCISLLEPGAHEGFPSWVEAASENGENVYILAAERLAAQDSDGLRDLYDVREGGGEAAKTPEEKCNLLKEECQGNGTEPIGESGVGSNGPGKESTGTKTEETPPVALPPVKVLHRSSTSRGVTVTFKVGGAGLVRLSGGGLTTAARILGRGGTLHTQGRVQQVDEDRRCVNTGTPASS